MLDAAPSSSTSSAGSPPAPAPAPGKSATTSTVSRSGAAPAGSSSVPPELLALAETTVDDGHGWTFVLQPDGSFRLIGTPPGKEAKKANPPIKPNDPNPDLASAWKFLAAKIMKEHPAPAATTSTASATTSQAETTPAPAEQSTLGWLYDQASAVVSGAVSFVDELVEKVWPSTPVAPGTPAAPGAPAPVPAPAPAPADPAAPIPTQMVVPPGGRYYKEAGATSSSGHVDKVTPATVVETKTLPKTIPAGFRGTEAEAGQEDWLRLDSDDPKVKDKWVKFGGLTREDEFSAAMVPDNIIPTDGLAEHALDMARLWNLKGKFIDQARAPLGLSRGLALAVLKLESRGFAFGTTGKPVAVFEVHKLYSNNEGLKVDWGKSNQAKFDNHFRPRSGSANHEMNHDGVDKGGTWSPFHGSQSAEYAAIDLATSLADRETALRCISMGAGQVMGYNAAGMGYASASEMFDKMNASAADNVDGIFDFIASKPEAKQALAANDLKAFVTIYNGTGKVDEYAATLTTDVAAFTPLETKYLNGGSK